jgi:hypothetical protein
MDMDQIATALFAAPFLILCAIWVATIMCVAPDA